MVSFYNIGRHKMSHLCYNKVHLSFRNVFPKKSIFFSSHRLCLCSSCLSLLITAVHCLPPKKGGTFTIGNINHKVVIKPRTGEIIKSKILNIGRKKWAIVHIPLLMNNTFCLFFCWGVRWWLQQDIYPIPFPADSLGNWAVKGFVPTVGGMF